MSAPLDCRTCGGTGRVLATRPALWYSDDAHEVDCDDCGGSGHRRCDTQGCRGAAVVLVLEEGADEPTACCAACIVDEAEEARRIASLQASLDVLEAARAAGMPAREAFALVRRARAEAEARKAVGS